MSTDIQDLSPQSNLLGLDPHLSFIASQAAIELDKLVLGISTELNAVKQLATRLKNSTEAVLGSPNKRNLMDPRAIRVFSQAYSESLGEPVTTIDELATKAWHIAGDLDGADDIPQTQNLARLRDFCVALSRIASSHRKAMMDRKPGLSIKR